MKYSLMTVKSRLIITQRKVHCAASACTNMRGEMIDSIDGAKFSVIVYRITETGE